MYQLQDASAKSAAKAARKAIPANFVEIIDTLVDKLASYKGVILSNTPKPADAGKNGSAEGSAAHTRMESNASASQQPAASSSHQQTPSPHRMLQKISR